MITKEVYIIRNTINNKVYIGQTQSGYEKRFKVHKTCHKSSYEKSRAACPKLYNAMRKHGADNFYPELLEANVSIEDVDEREAYYIAEYDAVDSGYNVLIYSTNRTGYKVSDEQIRKSKERWADPEYKEAQKASRRAIRKKNDKRSIKNLNTGKVHRNRYVLADKLNIEPTTLHKVCQNMVNTIKGTNYVYIDTLKKVQKLERLKTSKEKVKVFYEEKKERDKEARIVKKILKSTEAFYDTSFIEDYKNGMYDDIP